jgi:uncharacterized metal-binding protein YceD (DUF177 family)
MAPHGAESEAATPEFSRPLGLDDIGDDGVTLEFEATGEERAALARRFDLVAIERLTVRATACHAPARDGLAAAIRVAFDFVAEVVQRCVVSLEPVAVRIAEHGVEVEFARGAALPPAAAQLSFALDDVDPPEPLPGECIDLGELVAEHLALALDPYPRKKGAVLAWPAGESEAAAGAGEETSFAVLRRLRDGSRGRAG